MKHSELRLYCHHKVLSSPIACSYESFDFFMRIWDKNLIRLQEQSYILYLNAANEVIEWKCLTTGTGIETLFDIKLTLGIALGVQASKIIVAHNHPSCILRPSRDDIHIMKRLKDACQLMDIKIEDTLIVCQKGYFSFADEGLLNNFKQN